MTDYKEFIDELEKQLKPIKDAINVIMHPETGFYPQVKEIKDSSKRAHERLDRGFEKIKAVEETLYGKEDKQGLVDVVRELDNHRKQVVKVLLWIAALVGAPTVSGIGYLIWKSISGQ